MYPQGNQGYQGYQQNYIQNNDNNYNNNNYNQEGDDCDCDCCDCGCNCSKRKFSIPNFIFSLIGLIVSIISLVLLATNTEDYKNKKQSLQYYNRYRSHTEDAFINFENTEKILVYSIIVCAVLAFFFALCFLIFFCNEQIFHPSNCCFCYKVPYYITILFLSFIIQIVLICLAFSLCGIRASLDTDSIYNNNNNNDSSSSSSDSSSSNEDSFVDNNNTGMVIDAIIGIIYLIMFILNIFIFYYLYKEDHMCRGCCNGCGRCCSACCGCFGTCCSGCGRCCKSCCGSCCGCFENCCRGCCGCCNRCCTDCAGGESTNTYNNNYNDPERQRLINKY